MSGYLGIIYDTDNSIKSIGVELAGDSLHMSDVTDNSRKGSELCGGRSTMGPLVWLPTYFTQ